MRSCSKCASLDYNIEGHLEVYLKLPELLVVVDASLSLQLT
jgi:hypothetical protein